MKPVENMENPLWEIAARSGLSWASENKRLTAATFLKIPTA
jgi:hypothetical protein